jgi:hypothetical protein
MEHVDNVTPEQPVMEHVDDDFDDDPLLDTFPLALRQARRAMHPRVRYTPVPDSLRCYGLYLSLRCYGLYLSLRCYGLCIMDFCIKDFYIIDFCIMNFS